MSSIDTMAARVLETHGVVFEDKVFLVTEPTHALPVPRGYRAFAVSVNETHVREYADYCNSADSKGAPCVKFRNNLIVPKIIKPKLWERIFLFKRNQKIPTTLNIKFIKEGTHAGH